jgi:hypothetical protein
MFLLAQRFETWAAETRSDKPDEAEEATEWVPTTAPTAINKQTDSAVPTVSGNRIP